MALVVDGDDNMENGQLAAYSRRTGMLVRLALILVGVAFAGVAVSLYVTLAGPYDPFGEFPIQNVLNRDGETTTPIVRLGTPVIVEGTKCYTEEVEITGEVTWRLVSPEVAIVRVGTGVVARAPGCHPFTFRNDWPLAAVTISRDILDSGRVPVWEITGFETPTQGGINKPWRTQTFEVVELEGVGS